MRKFLLFCCCFFFFAFVIVTYMASYAYCASYMIATHRNDADRKPYKFFLFLLNFIFTSNIFNESFSYFFFSRLSFHYEDHSWFVFLFVILHCCFKKKKAKKETNYDRAIAANWIQKKNARRCQLHNAYDEQAWIDFIAIRNNDVNGHWFAYIRWYWLGPCACLREADLHVGNLRSHFSRRAFGCGPLPF